jgi:tetratricopeptide (TPR) repeat protein
MSPQSTHILASLALLALFPALHAQAAAPQTRATPTKPQPQAPSPQSDPLAPLLAQAQEALDRNDFLAAIPLLEKIVAAKPADALPHFELGRLFRAEEKSRAIAEYRQAISLDANLAPAHLNLGLAPRFRPSRGGIFLDRAAHCSLGRLAPYLQAGSVRAKLPNVPSAILQYHAAAALRLRTTPSLSHCRALFADGKRRGRSQLPPIARSSPTPRPRSLGRPGLLKEQKVSRSVDVLRDYLQKAPDDRAARASSAPWLCRTSAALTTRSPEVDRLDRDAPPAAESLKLRGRHLYARRDGPMPMRLSKASPHLPAVAQLHAWMGHTKMELHDYVAAQNELRRALEDRAGRISTLARAGGRLLLVGAVRRHHLRSRSSCAGGNTNRTRLVLSRPLLR